ncbi:MAG: TerC family protein [Bryobacteraceae bacterium]
MFNWLADPQAWIALGTLTVLEIVLGIDNIIFISILASRLPAAQQPKARTLGLAVALISRLALLFSLAFLAHLTDPLFSVFGRDVSARDLVLIIGGLFLLVKSGLEIYARLEGDEETMRERNAPTMLSVVLQIMVLDIVFSLDSVITAVGMVDQVGIMATAVIIAVGVMMFASGPISNFVDRYPTVKMLALAFLLLVGVALIAEGIHQHLPKGYVYFSMAFSVFVELLNIRARQKAALARLMLPLSEVSGSEINRSPQK